MEANIYSSAGAVPTASTTTMWARWVYAAALAVIAVVMALSIMRMGAKYTILGIITLAGIALVTWKAVTTNSVVPLLLLLHIILALAAAPRHDLKVLTGVVALATIAVALFGLVFEDGGIMSLLTYGALIAWSLYLVITLVL